MNDTTNGYQQGSCGIKKIIDCKVTDSGQQMYKVKWEPTWEPAENLANCQHLVDEFWSYVNKVKTNEEKATLHYKKIKLENIELVNGINNLDKFQLANDSKASIQHLMARTNSTSVGTNNLTPPSALNCQQTNKTNGFQNFDHKPTNHISETNMKIKNNNAVSPFRSESLSPSSKTLTNSSLKYLENFDNPYVKVAAVCKICNKEQSFKVVSNWKRHYLTHSDEKPHKCPHCDRAFVQSDKLRNHLKSKHGIGMEEPSSMVPSSMVF